ncbi:MAG: class I SAM-dependent RNA methyltransferase [Candidatus Hadarchaeales archaeon]
MRLLIKGMGEGGEGLAEWGGRTVRVLHALPGEEVEAELLGEGVAVVREVLSPSPDRREPPCPLFPRCAGCQLQHLRYDKQLEFKREKVERALGRRVEPPLSGGELGYRNHARLTARRGEVGFLNKLTGEFVRVDRCLLMSSQVNELLPRVQGRCFSTMVSLRVGVRTGEYLIQPNLFLQDLPTGQPFYHEVLLDRRFRISASSFFQTNTEGAEEMVRTVREWIGSADRILDAYAGVGTFASLLSDLASEVLAVEASPSAEKDALHNLRGLPNVRFVRRRVEEVLPMEGLDVLLLDPPRQGCSERVIEAINRSPPRRIVYVSCNPTTLGRDLARLRGFNLERARPLDLFAQTKHVECVALLERTAE